MEFIHISALQIFRLNEHRTIHLHSIDSICLLFVVHSYQNMPFPAIENPSNAKRTSVCHTGNRLTEFKWKKWEQTNWSCCCAKITSTQSVWHAFGVNISIPLVSYFGFPLEIPNSSCQNRSIWRNDVDKQQITRIAYLQHYPCA